MTHPSRHPYDPGDPYPEHAFEGDCPLLVLLAAPDADADWAAESALSLARQWADRGERVFLADLSFSKPRLHDALGVPNGEGMSDLFLFGASLRRIARVAPEGFFFASAGTPIPNGRRVLTSSRWSVLTRGFAKAGAHLVVLLPFDEPGSRDVLTHAERVLLLTGANGQNVLESAGAAANRIAGVLSPRSPRPAARGPSPKADVASAVAAASAAVPPAPDAMGTATAVGGKTDGKPRGKEEKTFSAWILLLLVALGALALVGVLALTGVIQLPWGRAGSNARDEAGVEVGAAAGSAEAPDGSYFLQLGLYAAGVAALQVDMLGERRPDLLFIVSPVEVNGQVLERLLVGERADSALAATELRESLARTLASETPDWPVRAGSLSFHLGTYETLKAADARLQELNGRDVPAFLLKQAAQTGAERFDVWAGAYADSVDAAYLERTLIDQGIVPILRRRTGELLPE